MSTAVMTVLPDVEPALPDLYEMVEGQIVEKTVSALSTEVIGAIDQLLGGFVRANRLGKVVPEMLFRISAVSDLQRRPDVAFVSTVKWAWNKPAPDSAAWDMVPDLAVEVTSPTNKMDAVMEKMDEYFDAGVGKIWLVLPVKRRIFIFESVTKVSVLTQSDILEDPMLFPGLSLPLASIFGEP